MKVILDSLKPVLIGSNNDNRQWVFIGADGPPYTLLRRIIKEEPDTHDWVILVSGNGHLGMNELKTFFRVIDKIFGEVLGKDVLNFSSPNAYSFFIDCKDTHKAWQTLEIFLHGTTMELLQLYKATLKEETSNAQGFLQWQSNMGKESQNFRFISQMSLNVALAIYIQRIGDRNNDEEVSDSGRFKFMNMFYGFNHPIYCEVEYNELKQKVCYPTIVSQLRKQNSTFGNPNSDVKNNHEGGDFKLENQIKKIKSLTPKGKKDKDMWQKTIRSTPAVDKLLKHGKKMLNIQDISQSRWVQSEQEIVKWRARLRHSKYLSVKTKYVQSMSGVRMNDELSDFSNLLRSKRLLYWEMVCQGTPLQSIRYKNISIKRESEIDAIECYECTHTL